MNHQDGGPLHLIDIGHDFLDENAQTLIALRDRVTFRHLRSVLDAVKTNLGGVLPNAEVFDLVPEEA